MIHLIRIENTDARKGVVFTVTNRAFVDGSEKESVRTVRHGETLETFVVNGGTLTITADIDAQ